MTERENLLRMLSGEQPERLPLDVWVTEPARDLIEEHCGTRNEVEALGLCGERLYPRFPSRTDLWHEAYGELGVSLGPESSIGELGTVHDSPPKDTLGRAYHLLEMRHPLEKVESVAQLERLPWPDVDEDIAYAHLPGRVAEVRAAGRSPMGAMDCTLFEMAWYVRGMERLFMDLVDGTGVGDWLLDWYTHRSICGVRRYVQAGVDVVWLGDDVGTQRGMMMAVPFWREHLKPRLRRVVEAVRDSPGGEFIPIAYHSDGDVRDVVEDLIELGIEILNPVQPECMPIREVVARHGDRLAFWGMIGTQSTMPFGTPADVARCVAELQELAEGGARIVAQPTHALEPDVPWENIRTLVEEARRPLRKADLSEDRR